MKPHETLVLKFDNPTFREGVNVTVRYGEKWRDSVEIGDRVELGGTPHSGRIVGKLYENLHKIPAPIHNLNHDPTCRTTVGITKELSRIYGPFPNGVLGAVTVLFFVPEWGADR